MEIKELFSKEAISKKVCEIASQISEDYKGKEIFVVCVLNGSVFFTTDLIREFTVPCSLNFIKAKSYEGTQSTGVLNIEYGENLDIEGKDVLIVEDIIDTGNTLSKLIELYKQKNPKSIKLCAFLDKKARRIKNVEPDYIGYSIDDYFVIGYGMDYNNKYRELPYIGIVTL